MSDMQKYYDGALEILNSNIYCTLSTASNDGEPWVSPVFFAFDKALNIYWLSEETSKHSELIKSNSRVSCVVFNSDASAGADNAVYFSGNAEIYSGEDVNEPLNLLEVRGPKAGDFSRYEVSDVTGESPWRLYHFTPSKAWILGENQKVRGWAVVRRLELELAKVK